jgi:hypothetical protein
MNEIKFSISDVKGLGLSGIVKFTDDRMKDMEDCSDFLPTPTPSLTAMLGLRNDFQDSEAAFNAVPTELNKSRRNTAYNALIAGHAAWIAYAEPLIGSDETKAARFGYPQYAKRTSAVVPTGEPPRPTFRLTENPGEVMVRAKVYRQGTKPTIYTWQVSEDAGETYQTVGANTSHRRLLKLGYGKLYYIRVSYSTTAGEGLFSEHLEISLTKNMVAPSKKTKKVVA